MKVLNKLGEWLINRRPVTADYRRPSVTRFKQGGLLDQLPFFHLTTADIMMADPQVSFGLKVRDGALMMAEAEVTSDDSQVAEWIQNQWDRIWNRGSNILLRTKRYGSLPCEVLYRQEIGGQFDGFVGFSDLRDIYPHDSRLLTKAGMIHGFRVRRLSGPNAAGPKVLKRPAALWTSYEAEWSSGYGRSILEGAYAPWWEKWMDGGSNEIKRLRMMKDGYNGDIVWAAPELVPDENGNMIYSLDLARQMIESRPAGAVLTLPMLLDREGNRKLDYTPPQDTGVPQGIFDWNDGLDTKIWKGLGVFPEVVEAATSGSGFSGRSVPMMMFMGSVQNEVNEILKAVDRDILRPIAQINFGRPPSYEIKIKSLSDTLGDSLGGTQAGGPIGGTQPQQPPQMMQPQQIPPRPQQTQFGEDSVDPTTDDLIEIGTSKAVKAIRDGKKRLAEIVKKKD